jgi:8-oxo-dGTP pyrophosphatase MutT (NUDIX family)
MPVGRVEKVAAFITRASANGGRELLVFEHDNPLAGIQVPAGSVEPGETPLSAVLREVSEEAGLTGVEVVGAPTLAPLELADDEWYLVLDGTGRSMLREYDLAGPVVRVAERDPERVLLIATHPNGDPVEWWASPDAITRDVPRWLFNLRLVEPAPDTWERAYDRTAPWRFYWVPLSEFIPLYGVGSDWLTIMRPRLETGG